MRVTPEYWKSTSSTSGVIEAKCQMYGYDPIAFSADDQPEPPDDPPRIHELIMPGISSDRNPFLVKNGAP